MFLSAPIAIAVDCTDTDDGPSETGKPDPFIGESGIVKYGLTEKSDMCVSNEDGYHLENTTWIREYYCYNVSGTVQRTSKDYDCTRYGYTRCENGKCVGKQSKGDASTTRVETVGCGNKKLESGEQCDPPDSICYLNEQIGICTRNNAQGYGGCQCKLYQGKSSTETPAPNTTAPAETAPVTTPPAATTPPASSPPAVEQPPAQPETSTPVAEASKERAPLPTEDLDSSKGIGITRGITHAVKRFFSWIGSWFG